jgi:benzoyl-CoA reductase/2-hydroxyglutaryl-CoA dehydratase subunit BcrC/BadD/HgdB
MNNTNHQHLADAAFLVLLTAYENRLDAARLAHQQGHKVVGYVGNTVPVELIMAADCMPVCLAPNSGSTALADPYIESFSDTDVRLIFAMYCDGAYDFLDLLIIPRSTESQHKLFLSLREARRTGIVSQGPELWLYDILHTQRPSSQAYGLARTQALQHKLAELSGIAPTDKALHQAIVLTNSTRGLLQTLHQRRLARPISGWEALVATGAMRFLTPLNANVSLRTWLEADTHIPRSGPRLLIKGCPLDHDALHRMVERVDARVVMEDDDWGARAGTPRVATDRPPLNAVFEHYWRDVPCVRLHPATSGNHWFGQALANAAIDGVVFYLPQPDDIYGWSFPAERNQVEQTRLPWLLIRHDARTPGPSTAQLANFVASLTQRPVALA